MIAILRFVSVTRRALPRVLPLLRNAKVPLWLKVSAIVAALVIISPLDPFGDIPILGFVDDAVLLALLVNGFVKLAEGGSHGPTLRYAEAPMKRVG